jgi:hypothetical protein
VEYAKLFLLRHGFSRDIIISFICLINWKWPSCPCRHVSETGSHTKADYVPTAMTRKRLHYKLLKKCQGTLCPSEAQFLLSNHRVVLPWCTHALAFIELPVHNVKSQDFHVSLVVHLFVKNLLWQKCWGSRKR